MEKKKQHSVKEFGFEKTKSVQTEAPMAIAKDTPKILFALDTKLIILALVGIALLFFVTYNSGQLSGIFSSDAVIATVNGLEIMQSDLQEELDNLPAYYKTGAIDEETLRSAILDQLIARALLLGEAESKGITVSDAELEATIANITAEAQVTLEELEQKLEEQNVTLSEFQETVEKQIIMNKLIEQQVLAEVSVTEEELLSYYETQKETLAEVRASHILICYIGTLRCEETITKEEALEQAATLIERIKAGESFEVLAKEYSTDPSAEFNGGDLGWFAKGDMVAEFETAAFSLNAAEMTEEPVETAFGYHIIMVTDKKETLEDVKEEILATLTLEKQKTAVENYVLALKQVAEIVYEEE